MKKILLLCAVLLFPVLSHAANYNGIPDNFFGYIKQGKTDAAIDFLYNTNKWVAKNSDQVQNLKGQLARLQGLVGSYVFHELISEQTVGTHYAHLIYLVGYERQPVRFEIKVYKVPDQWRFQGVSFDTNLTQDIDKLANQRLLK